MTEGFHLMRDGSGVGDSDARVNVLIKSLDRRDGSEENLWVSLWG